MNERLAYLIVGACVGSILGLVFAASIFIPLMVMTPRKAIEYLENHGGTVIDQHCAAYCDTECNERAD